MRISKGMAVAFCVLGMTLVGSSVSVSQLLLDYPTLTAQAIRYAAAAAVLFLIAHRFPRLGGARPGVRPTARELGILLVVAATGMAGFNACIMLALHHDTEPAVVGTVIGAAPLGLALLGPLIARGRPSSRLIVAATVVVAGTALVEGTGRATTVGLLGAAGALAGEILFSLLAAIVLPRLGAVRVAAWSCALAVPLLAVGALVAGEPAAWRLPTATEAGALVYLAGLMTVVAFVVWFIGLERLGVERAGILVGLMPVATLATAAVMATALPGVGPALGVLTVAVGLAFGLTGRSRTEAPASAEQPPSAEQSRAPEPAALTATT
ncbi:DMT family transporter [Asanoa sp. WMMD1127]|uniref:DMT family transporter n=1 Tax=Asanoa sp. WMMD1127 TaxID=3016107 RepID=UPI002415F83F|nr:DMT family transporter [Asanoa sp. WMMD1127]MDG4821028.1 DMT family transporter [Asanoa sp. WMMD1127]